MNGAAWWDWERSFKYPNLQNAVRSDAHFSRRPVQHWPVGGLAVSRLHHLTMFPNKEPGKAGRPRSPISISRRKYPRAPGNMEAAGRHAARGTPGHRTHPHPPSRAGSLAQHASRSRRVTLDPTGAEPGAAPRSCGLTAESQRRALREAAHWIVYTLYSPYMYGECSTQFQPSSIQPQRGDCRVARVQTGAWAWPLFPWPRPGVSNPFLPTILSPTLPLSAARFLFSRGLSPQYRISAAPSTPSCPVWCPCYTSPESAPATPPPSLSSLPEEGPGRQRGPHCSARDPPTFCPFSVHGNLTRCASATHGPHLPRTRCTPAVCPLACCHPSA
jgi:hypothetical protein